MQSGHFVIGLRPAFLWSSRSGYIMRVAIVFVFDGAILPILGGPLLRVGTVPCKCGVCVDLSATYIQKFIRLSSWFSEHSCELCALPLVANMSADAPSMAFGCFLDLIVFL